MHQTELSKSGDKIQSSHSSVVVFHCLKLLCAIHRDDKTPSYCAVFYQKFGHYMVLSVVI